MAERQIGHQKLSLVLSTRFTVIINDVPVLLLNQPNAAQAATLPVSVVSLSTLLYSVTIDLLHDTRHLCMRFRIDGMKAMSRGISEGKQKIKFANARNCRRLCLLSQNKTMI